MVVSNGRRGASRRIALVADELLGYVRDGLGTTTTFVAVALARMGHQVEVLYLGSTPEGTVTPEWQELYDEAGVVIRPVARSGGAVEPTVFARMRDVDRALREEPPDVVLVQDLGSPAYTALRLRHLGLALERTLFVVLCHGTRQWTTDVSRKVRVLPGAQAVTVLERASLELADVVVSPSAYLLEWMRDQRWQLPARTFVIPHVTRSTATGEPQPTRVGAGGPGEAVERIVFFGRLEERKGIRPFVGALNALEAELLERVEVEFLGRPTEPWPPERIEGLLVDGAARHVRGVSFWTTLDQHEAITRLRRPGTLAVMPSFAEVFGNTVRECLEHEVPFLASDTAALCELVAEEDRARVLCEPSAEALAEALRRALVDPGVSLRPARAAFDDVESLRRWEEVLALVPRRVGAGVGRRPRVEVVVVYRGSEAGLSRCLGALAAQREVDIGVSVVVAGERVPEPASLPAGVRLVRSARSSVEGARADVLAGLQGEWAVFLDEEDVPEPELVGTLVRAQEASGADVVSCGLYLVGEDGGRRVHLFAGEPRALGLLANGYGTVALLRRSLLDGRTSAWPPEDDPDWPLLARLSVAGATIVSVPVPLVTRRAPPGSVERSSSDALLVVEELERLLPAQLASAARLAAGLAADARRPPSAPGGLARRIAKVVQVHGVRGAVRRVVERVLPTSR